MYFRYEISTGRGGVMGVVIVGGGLGGGGYVANEVVY